MRTFLSLKTCLLSALLLCANPAADWETKPWLALKFLVLSIYIIINKLNKGIAIAFEFGLAHSAYI